jgi:hypothetical protein
MISSFTDVVLSLERHSERAHLEGDLDIQHIETLLTAVYTFESEITSDLAKRAKSSIDSLFEVFTEQMIVYVQKFGTIKKGRRALRGYSDKKAKSKPVRVYRNV